MSQVLTHPEKPLTLQEVQEMFAEWRNRRGKKEPIPEYLWQAAKNLSKQFSITQISKALALNHTDLKKRIGEGVVLDDDQCFQSPAFIKIDMEAPRNGSQCVIEMEKPDGARLRMHFSSAADTLFLELGKAFWRNGL